MDVYNNILDITEERFRQMQYLKKIIPISNKNCQRATKLRTLPKSKQEKNKEIRNKTYHSETADKEKNNKSSQREKR